MKKILIIAILFSGLGITTVFSQTEQMKENATNLVEKLNDDIKAGNEYLALTEEQKAQIYAIHIERLMELRKAKKAGATKEERKAINKPYYKKIYSKVLNKHQKLARTIGKSKSKSKT